MVADPGGTAPERIVILATPRLRLRPWRESDFEPFAAMNADPHVMEYFPAPLTREQSDATARRIMDSIKARGWGNWAVEVVGGEPFIGFTGLSVPSFGAHFTPAIEVGWRLSRDAWGKGYATEAARAALAFGFDELGLAEIVSFTARSNLRSAAVMRRLGMRPDGEFDHPKIEAASPLRRHVLYRISKGTLPFSS